MRALEGREIPADPSKITAAVEGDIEAVDRVLRITLIRVRYALRVPIGKREVAERAIATHAQACPAAPSVQGCTALRSRSPRISARSETLIRTED